MSWTLDLDVTLTESINVVWLLPSGERDDKPFDLYFAYLRRSIWNFSHKRSGILLRKKSGSSLPTPGPDKTITEPDVRRQENEQRASTRAEYLNLPCYGSSGNFWFSNPEYPGIRAALEPAREPAILKEICSRKSFKKFSGILCKIHAKVSGNLCSIAEHFPGFRGACALRCTFILELCRARGPPGRPEAEVTGTTQETYDNTCVSVTHGKNALSSRRTYDMTGPAKGFICRSAAIWI